MIDKAFPSPAASITNSPFAEGELCIMKIRAMTDNTHSIVLVKTTIDSVRGSELRLLSGFPVIILTLLNYTIFCE